MTAAARKHGKPVSARLRNVSRVEALAVDKTIFVRPVGPGMCKFCGAKSKCDIDIFCCPLAKESTHCLWCGDDLVVPKGKQAPLAFCKPSCSVAFHKDVGSNRQLEPAKDPRLHIETIRRATNEVINEPWFWEQGTHTINHAQARFLRETPPAVIRALLERLAHAERVLDVARQEPEDTRVGREVRDYDSTRKIWGKSWKS